MKLVLHRLAEREMEDAFWTYEDQADGLGTSFLDQVQRSARHLLTFPESAPVTRRIGNVPIRKRVLARFPYDLFYTFDNDALSILAIAHQKRRPGYWIERAHEIL